jgi:hypothetical protein
LKELVDKQLTVTVVLDCCNSGGATRGDVEIRGGEGIDEKPLQPGQELLAPLEILEQTWRSISEQTTRGLKASGLRAARDYVLLAACRQNEFAYEYAFNRETKERNGALTYWLLDTLKQQNPGQTYQDLFDRINAKIHSQFPQQTPILMGEDNRVIFGDELAERVYAVPVLKVDKNTEIGEMQAVLGVGQANGVGKGAEFAIYPRTTTDLTKKENRVAIARIIQRGATDSLCKLEPINGEELNVEDGDRAVLVSPSVNLVRKVYLFPQEVASAEDLAKSSLPPNKLLPEIFKQQEKALEAIKNSLPGNGWVELAEEIVAADDDEGVAYQVVINNQEEYEICDRTGHPFQGIPPIKASDRDAAATVVKRLVHLAKYHATAELDNTDKDAPLAGKLIVEWLGTSDIYELGDKTPPKSQLKPFADTSKPTVKLGDYVFLSIQNNSFQALNVAVLDLASDWSIEQVSPGAENFITIEAGRKEIIPIRTTSEGQDIVKILATVGPINFRWLELPSLDEDIQSKGLSRLGNPLEDLLVAIDKDQPPTRKLSVARSPSREWTTKQVSLTIIK